MYRADLQYPIASMDGSQQRNVALSMSITRLMNQVVPLSEAPLA